MSIHGLKKRAALLVLGAAVAAVAGCGSDSDGGSAASGGGADLTAAQTLAQETSTRPTTLDLGKPVSKEIPTGKKIV